MGRSRASALIRNRHQSAASNSAASNGFARPATSAASSERAAGIIIGHLSAFGPEVVDSGGGDGKCAQTKREREREGSKWQQSAGCQSAELSTLLAGGVAGVARCGQKGSRCTRPGGLLPLWRRGLPSSRLLARCGTQMGRQVRGRGQGWLDSLTQLDAPCRRIDADDDDDKRATVVRRAQIEQS